MKKISRTFVSACGLFVVLLAPFIIFSCKDRPSDNGVLEDFEVAKIDLDQPFAVSFFDIFQKAEVIPMELNKNSAMSFVGKSILYKGRYYFFDRRQAAVFIFRQDGTFVNKVQKKGRGPGEYNYLSDFQINPYTGNLELLSPGGYLLIYDDLGEKCIETIKLFRFLPAVHKLLSLTHDIRILYTRTEGDQIYLYSQKKDQMVNQFHKVPDFLRGTSFYYSMHLYRIGTDICLSDMIDGDAYTVDTVSYRLQPHFKWDLGRYRFDISVIPKGESKEFYMTYYETISDRYAFPVANLGENRRYRIAKSEFRGKTMMLLYDADQKRSFAVTEFKEGFKCFDFRKPLFMDEQYFYILADPGTINDYVNSKVLDAENMKKVQALTDESNPVILRYRFR